MLLYSFYKNITFSLANLWFGFFSGFSAQVDALKKYLFSYQRYISFFQSMFDSWAVSIYNIFFTGLPIFIVAVFDQVNFCTREFTRFVCFSNLKSFTNRQIHENNCFSIHNCIKEEFKEKRYVLLSHTTQYILIYSLSLLPPPPKLRLSVFIMEILDVAVVGNLSVHCCHVLWYLGISR